MLLELKQNHEFLTWPKATDVGFESFLGTPNPHTFNFRKISEKELLTFCSKLKPKMSNGLDCLSNKLIKLTFPVIAPVITKLINMSLVTGTVLTQLKTSRVIPIYKDGSKSAFNNYRPISLISAFGKLVEKIVCAQLIYFLELHNILFEHQYGFRKNHDTIHPILHLIEKARMALSSSNTLYNIAVFIDLRKAFDTVYF